MSIPVANKVTLCHRTTERHGASRRFFAWEIDPRHSTTPVASAIPLKESPAEELDRRWLSIELDRNFAALSSIRFLEDRSTNNIGETIEQIERGDAPQLKSGAKQPAPIA